MGSLRKKSFFSPKTPKAARKFMSLLSISHRMANHSFAKHSHGSTHTEPALHVDSISDSSPTQREMRRSDGNSGLMHIVPRFPHLQTGVHCAALLCEEHRGSPGEGDWSCVGGWPTAASFRGGCGHTARDVIFKSTERFLNASPRTFPGP